jgi:hypothetical protein
MKLANRHSFSYIIKRGLPSCSLDDDYSPEEGHPQPHDDKIICIKLRLTDNHFLTVQQ